PNTTPYLSQPFQVIANLSHKAARPQRYGTRHRLLHVRVSGKCGICLARGKPLQCVHDVSGATRQLVDDITQIEANCSQHLVIARTAEVDAPARRANSLGQAPFKRRLTVLVLERDMPVAAGMLLTQGEEAEPDDLEILSREQILRMEHFDMRNGGRDVVADQPLVEGIVLASRVTQHATVKWSAPVPQATHSRISYHPGWSAAQRESAHSRPRLSTCPCPRW